MGLPESREARYTQRGKTQTSYWKADKIAKDTLRVRKVAPRPPKTQDELITLQEVIIGSGFKPQVPMIYAKLNQRPFQSREQFMKELERGERHSGSLESRFVEKSEEKRISSTSPRASDMRAMEFAKLLAEFDDI